MAEAEQRFDGRYLYTDYAYLENGEVGFVSDPHTSASVSSTGTINTYDSFNRLIKQTDSYGKVSTWAYRSGEITSTINGVSTQRQYLMKDVVVSVFDDTGCVDYEVDEYGRPVNIYHSGNCDTEISYDDYGRITQTSDMLGVKRTFTYDRNGYLTSVSQGPSVQYSKYDKYGRLLSQTFHDEGKSDRTICYTYNEKNLLSSEWSSNYSISYSYDSYGRLIQKNHRVECRNLSEFFRSDYTYNSINQLISKIGRLYSQQATIVERNTYAHGWHTSTSVNDSLVWKLDAEDNMGNVKQTHNYKDSIAWDFDIYGHLLSQNVSGAHTLNQTYTYDSGTGNLLTRNTEQYTYDSMNRLAGWRSFSYAYDDNGNLLNMPLLGELSYNGFKLASVSATSMFSVTAHQCDLDYFKSIERPFSIQENQKRIEFAYDGNKRRTSMASYDLSSGTPTLIERRFYIDDSYEIDEKIGEYKRYYYYVGGDAYDAPAVVYMEDSIPYIHLIYRDNTGSVVQYAGNYDSGQIHYTPWGTRLYMLPFNLHYPPGRTKPGFKFIRTYTGHEEIPYFGLLNANARIYNPYLGRFMSPDPILATDGAPQDFNPYVYARNNPLSYVDRDGEFPLFILPLAAAVAGGIMNVASNWDNIHGFGDGVLYFGIGAAASAACSLMTPFAMGGFTGGLLNGFVGGATSGLILSGGNAAASGGSIWKAGLYGAFQGGISGAFWGGLGGGLEAKAKGLNFWDGTTKSQLEMTYLPLNSNLEISSRPFVSEGELPLGIKPIEAGTSNLGIINPIQQNPDIIAEQLLRSPNFPKGNGTSSVYVGFDNNGTIRYVGITERNVLTRYREHINSGTARALLQYYALKETGNLSRTQARIIEQRLINEYGLGKNGGALYNRINSISSNKWEKWHIR